MEKVIAIREQDDLGPVIARADHRDGAIEVNRKIFYRLPPMVQEFVLCHEVCHLRYGEWDEAETNRLASEVFLKRASDADDLEQRRRFLSYMDGEGMSNSLTVAAVVGVVSALWGLGTSIYGVVKSRNMGWYSWSYATQSSNLDVMLEQAFEQSRKSSQRSAADFFWEIMYQYTNKDDSLEKFLNRSSNSWVESRIARYEKKYGFGFYDVTPVDWLAFPAVKFALGALVGVAVFLIGKQIIKNRTK